MGEYLFLFILMHSPPNLIYPLTAHDTPEPGGLASPIGTIVLR